MLMNVLKLSRIIKRLKQSLIAVRCTYLNMKTHNKQDTMLSQQDSAWSWVVLFCVVCCQVILGGICLSGGLFFVIFTNAFGADPVETSWLCSLPITMWFISQPLGSFLTNRYGCRVCSFVGGILAATGLSLSYLATSSLFLFISHGFLTGLGLGINYTGCMSALNLYFDRYKTVATGIASAGHNVGLIIFADIIVSLESHYSWRGMFLILGGVTLNLSGCAVSMFPFKVSLGVHNNNNNINSKETEKELMKKKSINFSVFRKLSFTLLCASNLFSSFSQGVYILHLPSYSKDAGFNHNDFGKVLMVYGISNIVGKIFFSFLGQNSQVNVILLYASSIGACGISMGLTPMFLTRTGMLVLAGLVGLFFCVTGALVNAIIHKLVGFNRFADGIGMSFPFKATGNLIGGPMAGVLLATTGSYAFSFYLAGVSMVFSALLLIHPIVHIKYREKQPRVKSGNIIYEKEVEETRSENQRFSTNKTPEQNEKLLSTYSKVIEIEIEDRIYEIIPEKENTC